MPEITLAVVVQYGFMPSTPLLWPWVRVNCEERVAVEGGEERKFVSGGRELDARAPNAGGST